MIMRAVKPYLFRLMDRPKADHLRYGAEDTEAKRFVDRVRVWTMEGYVRGIWNHIANEIAGESGGHADEEVRKSLRRKAQIRYTKAQALGMIIGWSDYVFCRSDRSLALECKSSRGAQRPGQIDFEKWCTDQQIPYRIFRTAEEGWDILVEEGYLDPQAWRPRGQISAEVGRTD
ncbi:hypothetical protein [Sphingomonas sp. 3-13AW]|uniref:hypothetical protein n=1 Tax=Sphingomonas sp. 3-13AW TaxID=3050450 RepID=UPI003BB78C0F